MICDHVGGIRDPLKQDLALEFYRNQNKVISILTETHVNHDLIHHIRNTWLGPIFFSSGDSHTKGLLVLLHLGLEGITEVDTDPKERFMSFKVTPSNDRVICVYDPSRYSIREQLAKTRFFEGLQNYNENKNEGNENKTTLGDLNCTMDKMDRDGENKTQRLYICCSNYANLWKKKNPDSPEFTRYDSSFVKDPGKTGSILIYIYC